MNLTLTNFNRFHVDPTTGFLPNPDPLRQLPAPFAAWDELGADLPALLLMGQARPRLAALPHADVNALPDGLPLERAMLLLSTFANAYVWGEPQPALRIPHALAVPLWHITERLGRKPIVSHASNALHNWRRLNPNGGITLDNLAILQPFLGSSDESWFVLVTVAIEACGAAALPQLVQAQTAAAAGDEPTLHQALTRIANVITQMSETLLRMYEKCDPHIFFTRIRPFLASWPVPGVVYEGVSEMPMIFAGGSAGQSSLVQALDAGLGVRHTDPRSSPFLQEMRHYMPPPHRRFIEVLEAGPDVRAFVQTQSPALVEVYNTCIKRLTRFRKQHMEIAIRYITKQMPNGAEATGTGGTSLAQFLGAVRQQTRERHI
jgi:indoleamine 2,3-dioxygenase